MKKEKIFVKIIRIFLILILLPFVLLYLIFSAKSRKKKREEDEKKIEIYSILQIDCLSGEDFENYLKILFEKMGYTSLVTKKSKDFGADLILSKKKQNYIVQAKCYSHTVGIKAIQEIIGARNHYKIYNAIVVTNNYFSKEAETLAYENGIRLVSRDELKNLILKFPVKFNIVSSGFSVFCLDEKQCMESKYRFWI